MINKKKDELKLKIVDMLSKKTAVIDKLTIRNAILQNTGQLLSDRERNGK